MGIVVHNITLDLKQKLPLPTIEITQNDTDSHVFRLTINNNGVAQPLSTLTPVIALLKSDGTTRFVFGNIIDSRLGLMEYTLGVQDVAVAGEVQCAVILYGSHGIRVSSVTFTYVVTNELITIEDIESASEYPVLTQLINDCNEILVVEQLRATAETERNIAEQIRIQKETIREQNEEQRLSAESSRQSTFEANEADRQETFDLNEIQRQNVFSANESQRVTAENTRKTAENQRVSNETTRQFQEELRQTGYAQMIANSYIIPREPVAKVSDLATISNPQNGWTVRILDDGVNTGRLYRYSSSSGQWRWIDTVTVAVYDAILNQINQAKYSTPVMTYETAIYLGLNAVEGQISVQIFGRSLRQELNYNRSTWVEWTLEDSSIVENGRLKLIRTTLGRQALLNTNVKSSTKYGILLYVYENTGNLTTQGNNTPFGDSSVLISGVGNKKAILTTQSSFTVNSLALKMSGNSTSVTIQDIRLFELPSGSEIESDFTNLTADQLAVKYPYIKGDGTKSTICAYRARSTGKNLFDYKKTIEGATSDTIRILDDNKFIVKATSSGSFKNIRYPITLKPNTVFRYTGQRNIVQGTAFIEVRNAKDDTLLLTAPNATNFSFTTSNEEKYILRFYCTGSTSVAGEVEYINVQIEEEKGQPLGVYESFKDGGTRYYPLIDNNGNLIYLRRLVNPSTGQTVAVDEFSDDGRLIKRVSDDFKLQSGHITSVNTTPANVDIVQLENFYNNILPNAVQQTNAINSTTSITGWTERAPATNADEYTIADVGKFYTLSNQGLRLIVAKNTYTNIEAARNALTGMTVNYQLAQEQTTQFPAQNIKAYPGGHLFFEKVLPEVGFYNNGLFITHTGYPMKSTNPADAIDFICKVDKATGAKVYLDVSQAVINANRLSFTHPGLSNGDLVDWDYFYPPELSTEAEKKISWPINLAATASDALNVAVNAEKITLDFIKYQRAINIKTDMRLSLLESGGA